MKRYEGEKEPLQPYSDHIKAKAESKQIKEEESPVCKQQNGYDIISELYK